MGDDAGNGTDEEPTAEPELPARAADLLADPSTWDEPPPGVLEGVLNRIRAERSANGPTREIALVGTELATKAAGLARIRESDRGVAVSLTVRELPPAPEGSHYEVWLSSADGVTVQAGTFDPPDSDGDGDGDDNGDDPVELWADLEDSGDEGERPAWAAVAVVLQRDRGRRRPQVPIVLRGTVPTVDPEPPED